MRSIRVKRSQAATASVPRAAIDQPRRSSRFLERNATVAKTAVAARAKAAALDLKLRPAMTPIAVVGSTIQKRRPRITTASTASGIRNSPKWQRIAQAGAKSASVRKIPRSAAPALIPATSSTMNGAAARTLTAAAALRRIKLRSGRRAPTTTPHPSVVVRMKDPTGWWLPPPQRRFRRARPRPSTSDHWPRRRASPRQRSRATPERR